MVVVLGRTTRKGYAGKGGLNDASNGHNGAGGAGFKAISCDVYVANVIVTDGQDGRSGPRGQMG